MVLVDMSKSPVARAVVVVAGVVALGATLVSLYAKHTSGAATPWATPTIMTACAVVVLTAVFVRMRQ
tara:strand:+ start:588 stop:788 length:201 start_codon:yes stop_codon:yes gene_type:complete